MNQPNATYTFEFTILEKTIMQRAEQGLLDFRPTKSLRRHDESRKVKLPWISLDSSYVYIPNLFALRRRR